MKQVLVGTCSQYWKNDNTETAAIIAIAHCYIKTLHYRHSSLLYQLRKNNHFQKTLHIWNST